MRYQNSSVEFVLSIRKLSFWNLFVLWYLQSSCSASDCTQREIPGRDFASQESRHCIETRENFEKLYFFDFIGIIGKKIKIMGKIYFSKVSIVSMQRLISLYTTSAFMECKFSALSPNFSSLNIQINPNQEPVQSRRDPAREDCSGPPWRHHQVQIHEKWWRQRC